MDCTGDPGEGVLILFTLLRGFRKQVLIIILRRGITEGEVVYREKGVIKKEGSVTGM